MMHGLREYWKPETIEEALKLLAREGVRSIPIAGGTSVAAGAQPHIEALVDIAGLPLDYIRSDETGLHIGSLTRLAALCDSPAISTFAGGALAGAAAFAGTSLLRNQGTLGGAILTPETSAELCAVLIVLDAEVVIQRLEGATALPLAALFEETDGRSDGAILTEVRMQAPPPGANVHCHRVSRSPAGPPILSAIALARTPEDRIVECRVAVVGMGPRPKRLKSLETLLAGLDTSPGVVERVVAKAIQALAVQDDPEASAEYRRAVLPVLIRRAILGQEGRNNGTV
jgi:CO/xanthine dehydrogenase FAD-binding subunit